MADKPAQFTVQDKHGIYQFPGELGRALTALVADATINAALYGNNGSLLATYNRDGLKVQGGLPVILKYNGKFEEYAVVVDENGQVTSSPPLGPAPLTSYLKFGWVLL